MRVCWLPDKLFILKPDVVATKGYSFQDDEKTIIDIHIDVDIAVEREKINEWEICTCANFKIGQMFSSVKSAEFFPIWRNFLTDEIF